MVPLIQDSVCHSVTGVLPSTALLEYHAEEFPVNVRNPPATNPKLRLVILRDQSFSETQKSSLGEISLWTRNQNWKNPVVAKSHLPPYPVPNWNQTSSVTALSPAPICLRVLSPRPSCAPGCCVNSIAISKLNPPQFLTALRSENAWAIC